MHHHEDPGWMAMKANDRGLGGSTGVEHAAEPRVERIRTAAAGQTRDEPKMSYELARALAMMRATLASTTDAILVTDERRAIVDFNEKYAALWNTPRELLERGCGREVQEYASRLFAKPDEFVARIEAIATGTQDGTEVLVLRDGRIVELHSKPFFIEDKLAGRVWYYRDVTERHAADMASRRLAAIVASSDDGIIGKDLNSIITSWNFGAEQIFGYTAEEMIGCSIMRLIPRDRQMEEADILTRIRAGKRVDHFETIRVRKDGQHINVSATISPIKDSTGRVVGASKVVRDITERKQHEASLRDALAEAGAANLERLELLKREQQARSSAEQANRIKDEFLATLSHELRTPLNAVLGWVNILRMEKPAGAELEEGLAVIERNARAQAQIIEDLLDMSRIISGKVRLEAQHVEPASIMAAAVETVRATADAKGVQLTADTDSFAASISGDPHRLQQVFWNLLSNAIKFTSKGGSVQVRLQRIHSHVEVSITDTGEGIGPEFLPHVFDRFQQADPSTTRRHGGLGLGLAIVKQLVELHGGSVSAHSAGKGLGACFTVSLPLVAGPIGHAIGSDLPVQRPAPEAIDLPAISLAGIHVLIVDDELDAREFLKRLLRLAGAKVSAAGSAAEALESIAAQRPDVLVCDIAMPVEDGYSLIGKVRNREPREGGKLPAVALTAYARTDDRTRAIRAGFHNHLAKPVEPAELLAVVQSLAGQSRS
jgi:PAS domain S-box-containing protein